ncbi:AtpZ/AtpI family protein [Neptunicella marina]|uniref:AtpZ/AtpI family protein n=1 Tax=Neptunicella marina TaxID=2125989 RepID=A0A8J6IRW4_9ALTE|nr:AtpZ/AtpI family protein [Neptunicella marina]MBC3764456.1 AtpZ/AtpI family protein [Neptunicella marina]
MRNKISRHHRQQKLAELIDDKARRKINARRDEHNQVWFGLGMMGLIGWSVALPTLLGIAIGMWLDSIDTGPRSWTLALLMAGLCVGCFIAWHWVTNETRCIHKENTDDDN